MLFSINLQEYTSATCFFSACRYSPSKICIHNSPFLYLADTLLQKFASATCFFSILQILPCKNLHPQLVFSLLADTLLQKFASATSLFSILQILSCKNLHPQLPFSLSCRYSPAKICIHNLLFLYLADTPHSNTLFY